MSSVRLCCRAGFMLGAGRLSRLTHTARCTCHKRLWLLLLLSCSSKLHSVFSCCLSTVSGPNSNMELLLVTLKSLWCFDTCLVDRGALPVKTLPRKSLELLHYNRTVYSGLSKVIFTARRYASAVLAVVVCPSVCLSVRLSVCLSVCHKPVLYRNGNT